jgi:hypothetical protein
VIDYATGWKIDFILPPFDEFHTEEFERRKRVDFNGTEVVVVSPEDIILAKLLWARAGQSEKPNRGRCGGVAISTNNGVPPALTRKPKAPHFGLEILAARHEALHRRVELSRDRIIC